MAIRSGLTIQNTRESGSTIKPMARANFGAQTETLTREIGTTTRLMASVTLNHKMAKSGTLESGRMTCTMARELKAGLMAHGSMVISVKERRMDLAHISGQMGHFTRATGSITRCRGMALINGSMEENLSANGMLATCMVRASTLGQTEESMRVTT